MGEVKEWIKSFIIALFIALPLTFVFRPTIVDGASMQPTLNNNNIVITEKISKEYKHGDIVVFDARPFENARYIKRIIGLPGDLVEIMGKGIYVNHVKLDEKYIPHGAVTAPNLSIIVPDDNVFVLGDNRSISYDSRYIGPVPIKKIKGRVYLKLIPFSNKI